MNVSEAVNSRFACRWFLDKQVDLDIVRDLIKGAGRGASNSNMQPWNVYALTGEPLADLTRQAVQTIESNDWRQLEAETEIPIFQTDLCEPYRSRRFENGKQTYDALGVSREDTVGRLEQLKRNYKFYNAPVGLFITIDRSLGRPQWADMGGYIMTLAYLARGRGLDTCPQVAWMRLHKLVREFLGLPPEQMLYCGMAIGYRDDSHPLNGFRSPRAEFDEFCKFYGFD